MSTYQKQCLLVYFGLYSGSLDGIFGPKSRAATEKLQRLLGLTPDGIFGPATEAAARQAVASGDALPAPDWSRIRHFRREDFRCKCGGRYCAGFPAEPSPALAEIADHAVDHFGKAFDPARDLVSGLRCPTHNQNEGGVANSRHLSGKALDFRIRGIGAKEVLEYIRTLPGVRYAYAIDGNYVHMDID